MIAAASEPAPGSVIASADIVGSEVQSGGIQRRHCSGVPSCRIGPAKKPALATSEPIGASPHASSSLIRQCVRTLWMPPPPYSSGRS